MVRAVDVVARKRGGRGLDEVEFRSLLIPVSGLKCLCWEAWWMR